jgi:hypothetical protein
MESEAIEIISRSIYKKFPEFSGTKPKVRLQSSPQTSGSAKSPTYLLTFENKVSISAGKNMTRWVRVTATKEGKILKVSTSR